jgi:hypothetical protein
MRLAVRGGRSSRGCYRSRNLVVVLEVKRGRLANTQLRIRDLWRCNGSKKFDVLLIALERHGVDT